MARPRSVASVVESFLQELMDDERTHFAFEEAEAAAFEGGLSVATPLIRAAVDMGFQMLPREPEKHVRGFTSNSHDRWSAYPSHGGAAYSQIMIQKYGSKDTPFG
jgi:hypothetical protein